MNPPSLDPPPDAEYPAFRTDNEKRRSIVWVGTNNGILEAIDARFGVEVWGFIPLNLLPKLRTLLDGQPVGSFAHFVDSSPKISDVKYDDNVAYVADHRRGTWRDLLSLVRRHAGRTWRRRSAARVRRDRDGRSGADLLLEPGPDHAELGVSLADEVRSGDRAVRRPELDRDARSRRASARPGPTRPSARSSGRSGPYAVLLGSGFLPYSVQQQTNRGGVVAGTTFYIVDAKTGAVLASKDVGSDGVNETNNNCATDNGAAGCQKIKNALMSDPVATGPTDSRYVTQDLHRRSRRQHLALRLRPDRRQRSASVRPRSCISAGADQPIFNSMATVTVGTKQYVFFGTGIGPAAADRQEHDLPPARRPRQRRDRIEDVREAAAEDRERQHDHVRRAGDRVPGGRRRHRVLHDDAC